MDSGQKSNVRLNVMFEVQNYVAVGEANMPNDLSIMNGRKDIDIQRPSPMRSLKRTWG